MHSKTQEFVAAVETPATGEITDAQRDTALTNAIERFAAIGARARRILAVLDAADIVETDAELRAEFEQARQSMQAVVRLCDVEIARRLPQIPQAFRQARAVVEKLKAIEAARAAPVP